jgi:amino acid transporter
MKTIGLWSAVSIGVGGMIGAGIFSILGVAGQIAGNAVYLAFVIAGGIALFSTYSYAKLGARFPSAGGPVEFLVRGLGDGVLSGGINVLLWLGYVFALSLYARAFGSYASTFLGPHASGIWVNVLGTGVVVLFTGLNFAGSRAVGRSELFIVATKVAILVLFAAVGLFFVKGELLSVARWPRPGNLLYASAVVFLAYEGFGLVTNAAEDMPDPRRTLPRALYLSVFISAFIYVAVSLAVIGNLPVARIIAAKDYALAEAARPFLGAVGFRLVSVAALFSTASAINATLYGGANVSYQVARDGQLPMFFDRMVWRKGVEGLVITSALVILCSNLLDLGGIAMLGSAAFLLVYCAVSIAHLRLWRETGARRWIVWCAIACCSGAFIVLAYYEAGHEPLTLAILAGVVAFSFLFEWGYRRSTRRRLATRDTA